MAESDSRSLRANLRRSRLGSVVRRVLIRILPRKAAILKYHSVLPDPDRFHAVFGAGTIHSQSVFDEQMAYLAKHCTPITLDQLAYSLRTGQPLPNRAVVVTFDDGFRDNAEVAAPILQRYQIPGHFFVTVGAIESGIPPWFCRLRYAFRATKKTAGQNGNGRQVFDVPNVAGAAQDFDSLCQQCARLSGDEQDRFVASIEEHLEVHHGDCGRKLMMDWDQIRALREAGHTVGSHSMTHPNLAYISTESVRWEMCESKRILERELRGPVAHFAYPSPILTPDWTIETICMSKEAAYTTAVTSVRGPVHRHASPWVLPRVSAPHASGEEFAWKVEASLMGMAT